MSTKSLTPGARTRLRAFYYTLWQASQAMNAHKPEDVLEQFAAFFLKAGPYLQSVVSILTPWALLITAITEHVWVRDTCGAVADKLMGYLSATVVIKDVHMLHPQILKWMSEKKSGRQIRTLSLESPFWGGSDEDDEIEWDADQVNKKKLVYVPDAGVYQHTFQGHRLTIERKITRTERSKMDNIVISCLSPFSGPRVIKTFLEHVQNDAAEAQRNRTTVFKPASKGWNWEWGISRPKRNLDAVTLEPKIKDQLVKDIEVYLNSRTRKYYAHRGIPWRRGFLFWGPPGTGKTSFTTALAGHFKLDVFLLSMSNAVLDDRRLESLFSDLPDRCIVLMEDIDSAGIVREDMNAVKKARAIAKAAAGKSSGPNGEGGGDSDNQSYGLTLSGLLNVLDGVHSVEGRILIMTTNNPNSLDEALVRQGRIDQRIEFAYASRVVSKSLFQHIFCKSAEELLPGEAPTDKVAILALAEKFALSFPEGVLTPGEVQGHLLIHRADPHAAVRLMPAYAAAVVEKRSRGVNVSNEINEAASSDGTQASEQSDQEAKMPRRSRI